MLNSFPLRFHHDAELGILRVSGDIDHADVDRLSEQLRERSETADVTVDLTEVTYLPSEAVGAMEQARQRARERGRALVYVAQPGTIAERVLLLMGLLEEPVQPDDETSPA